MVRPNHFSIPYSFSRYSLAKFMEENQAPERICEVPTFRSSLHGHTWSRGSRAAARFISTASVIPPHTNSRRMATLHLPPPTMIVSWWSYHNDQPITSSFTPRRTIRFSAQRMHSCLYLAQRFSDAQGTMTTSMLRDAQPDAHGIRRCPPREKGNRPSRRAMGGVGTTPDAILVPVTVALVCPILQPTGETRVEVLDFNAHCWRGEAYCGTYGYRYWATAGFVCKPSVFAVETVFANEMVTALPYYSMAASRQCELYVGHTIDEEICSGLKCI